jgi:hypothetical protein
VAILILYLLPNTNYFTDVEARVLNYRDLNILVVKPLLTANAYKNGGFYDYFTGNCDESCLSVQIDKNIAYTYDSSLRAIVRFEKLGATLADDYTLDPKDLAKYDRIILLHNEYVTQEFFDAVQNHPNVVYMYPNSLYGKVSVQDGKMTLIEGHGYNDKDNGFGWQYDNTRPYEADNLCENIQWIRVSNGIQLNCYPENFLMENAWLFGFVRDVDSTKFI